MRARNLVLAGAVTLAAVMPVQAQHVHTTPHDSIPDFCAGATIQSVAGGRWSSPGTWSPARVPTGGDRVLVTSGTSVTFDVVQAAALQCVAIDGELAFDTAVDTRLWAGEILVYEAGHLRIGTEAQPVPVARTAEVVIADKPLNPGADPEQYGTGLLAWGQVTIHGAVKQPTFVRVTQEPLAGHTALVLDEPAFGWRPGDRLILPDSRHMKWNEVSGAAPAAPQWEERTLQIISGDGRLLTLSAGLQFDHRGARDGNGALAFLPHVGNLSRNVVIRSERPIGSPGTRGHVLFTHRARIDVRYAAFRDLGRTTIAPLDPVANHIGRYPIHMHHVMGPAATPANGHQFTLIGNAVDGGSSAHTLKWGLAIHNSHYGLVRDNVLYNYAGALLMFEDGQESFNVVQRNFGVRSVGSGGRTSEGTEGGGFWFRGPNNVVRGNVAANLWGDTYDAAYGFKFFMHYLGDIRVPNYKGADTSVEGQYTVRDGNKMKIPEFSDNEVYGAAQGLAYWWLNAQDPNTNPDAEETIFRNLRIWHVYNRGVFHYPAARVTFDGLRILGDPAGSACCASGVVLGDYAVMDLVMRNVDIQGMDIGVFLSTVSWTTQVIENSYLRNRRNIYLSTLFSTNGGAWLPARRVFVRNVRFDPWPGTGTAYAAIEKEWNPGIGEFAWKWNVVQADEVVVYGYQGAAGDNFRVYYAVQASQNVAGGLAPCATTRAEIRGLVCSIPPDPSGAAPPTAPAGLMVTP